jgi:periplasmic divalent cation tolerance protein
MKMILVQTTCQNKKEAKKIAKELVKNSLAACVQISKIDSFYIWNKEFCNDKEVLLSIKTKKKNFKEIEHKIKEFHSYDVPEIICLKIEKSSKDYKKFIDQNC